MADYEPIELQIEASASNAQSKLDKIDEALGNIQGKIKGITGALGGLSDSGKTLSSAISGLSDAINKVKPDGLKGLSDSLKSVSSNSMNDVAKSADVLSDKLNEVGESASKIDDVSSAVGDLSSLLRTAEDIVDDFKTHVGEAGTELQKSIGDGINTETFNVQMTNLQNIVTSGLTRVTQAIGGLQLKLPPVDTTNIDKASEEIKEKLDSAARPDTWEDVMAEIEKLNNDYEQLSHTMGEANAQMQILVETRNALKQAFSATESGKMLWDNEKMSIGYEMLKKSEEEIERVKKELQGNFDVKFVVDPTGELEKLYAELNKVKTKISDMRSNKINFSTEDMTSALKRQEEIQKRIQTIEGTGKKDDLPWMAQIIAIQHELEKASQAFDKFANIAKKAFLKALTPLKLFKHELEEIKGLVTMVSRVGSAFAMISKPITKVFGNIKKQIDGIVTKIQKAWAKVLRTFTFMLIRKAITQILSTINEATQSLAEYSKSIGTSFNESMSYITSDLRYIGASLVAMAEPLINKLAPAFDSITDKIVNVINTVNKFLAIITGAKSYTIAKKKIVDYTEATKDANKAVKQLTLGIDELNILNDDKTENKQDESMFEWEEIPTPKIDIPDWLKWLKELWEKLKKAILDMLKALWDAIQKAWVNVKDMFLAAFKHLLESLVGLITDIIRDLTRVFKTKEFQEFLERVFRIIAKIAELLATIIDKIREAWNYNDLGFRILMDILAILNTIATHIENILDMTIAWARELTFIPLFEAIEAALHQVNYAIDQIGYTVERVWGVALDILKLAIEDYIPRLIGVLGDVIEGIGNIFRSLNDAWDKVNFRERFVKAFDGIVQEIIPHLEEVGEYFKIWADHLDFKPLLNSIINLFESLKPVADFVGGVFADLVEHYILPMAKHIVEDIIPGIANAIANFADAVDWGKLRTNIDKIIQTFQHLSAAIGEGVVQAMDYLGQALAKFINSDKFERFINVITGFVNQIDGDMVAKVLSAIGLAILKIADALMSFVVSQGFQDFINGLINFVKNKSINELADILLGIAKAFLAFKGLSFLAKSSSTILGFITLLGKLATVLGPGGIVVVAIGAAIAAFALFGDTLAAIDWTGLLTSLMNGLVNMVNKIDWSKITQNIVVVLGKVFLAALETVFNPAWMMMFGLTIEKAIIEAIKGIQLGLIEVVASLFEAIGLDSVAGFIRGIGKKFEEVWDFISGLFDRFIQFVKDILGIHSPSTVFQYIGEMVVQGLWNGIKAIWGQFFSWLSGIWNEFIGWVKEIWASVVQAVLDAWTGFIEKIQAVWDAVKTWFSETWENFKTWCSEIWTAIIQAIVDTWSQLIEFVTEIWTNFCDWITEAWGNFKDWATGLWTEIKDFIISTWEELKQKALEIWAKIKETIKAVWDWLKDTVSGVFNKIKQVIIDTWNAIKSKTIEIWNAIKTFLMNLFQAVHDKILEIWNKIKQFLKETYQKIHDFTVEIWNKIKQFIHDTFQKIHDFAVEIWNKIKMFLIGLWEEIKKKANEIFGWIRDFIENIWNTIKETWEKIWHEIVEAVLKIWNDFKETVKTLWDEVLKFLEGLWDGIQAAWEKVWKTIIDAVKKIWSIFTEEIPKIWKAITDKIKDIWNGVKEAWEKVWGGIKDFIKDTANTIAGFLEGVINGAIKGINKMIDLLNAFKVEVPDWVPEIGGKSFGFSLNKISEIDIPRFAYGGFPEDGWFRASHGEIMGTFDNGQSVVANNDQITEGIAQAVSKSLVPLLADIAETNREVANKSMSLEIDSREIARASNVGQMKLGRPLVSLS